MNKKDLIAIRDFDPKDTNFIYDTWLNSLRHGNDLFGLIDNVRYYEVYRAVITLLLKDATIKVACLKEDDQIILGYSVSRGDTLDFAYVKEMWRKLGIFTDLLPLKIKTITHLTKAGHAIWKKKFPDAIFDPFLGGA